MGRKSIQWIEIHWDRIACNCLQLPATAEALWKSCSAFWKSRAALELVVSHTPNERYWTTVGRLIQTVDSNIRLLNRFDQRSGLDRSDATQWSGEVGCENKHN